MRADSADGWIVYFAYGSNLHPGWLARRVPSARVIGPAELPGHRLVFRKRGRDGSAKSDAAPDVESTLPGAVYAMHVDHLDRLGAAEGGYARREIVVVAADGPIGAFAYFARPEHHVAELAPWHWYVALIREGARRHGLPPSHQAWLAEVVTDRDPDPQRCAAAEAVLSGEA